MVKRKITKTRSALDQRASRTWKHLTKDVRHCFRCGELLVWEFVRIEEKNRLVCSECKLIAYQNPKIVGATLPVRDGKIFLLRRAIEPGYGLWTFPAGYMELGETVEECAQRETWEEIRARVKLAGVPRLYSYPDAVTVTIVYPATVLTRTPSPGPESLEVKLFSKKEIPWKTVAFRSTRDALRDWAND
ncbi:MAG: NUDIX domain-containing protein [Elusimicrobia bacterium]|nr:NUDIX domain-containing protein [Elusimicrobiota bacterium]